MAEVGLREIFIYLDGRALIFFTEAAMNGRCRIEGNVNLDGCAVTNSYYFSYGKIFFQ